MASYGFIRTSSTRNSDGSTRAGSDPYAGTTGATGNQIPMDFAPVDPYSGTGGNSGSGEYGSNSAAYTPQNYTSNSVFGPSQQTGGTAMYTPTPAPVYQSVGNVTPPTGYENTIDRYNDPDYRNAMTAWSQNSLPTQQAMNNQQNTDREYAFNSWLQQNQLGQVQWRDQQANNLAWSGLTLQQQAAQDAANQWGAEFAYTGQRDQRNDWVNDRDYQASIVQANRDYGISREKLGVDSARQQADAAYQQGTLSNQQYANEISRLKQLEDNHLATIIAERDYEQSGQKIQIDSARQQADAAYQQGTLDVNRYKAEIDRLAQIENNARQTAADRADAAYKQGSLQQQRYSTDTGAQISREQIAQQRYGVDTNAQLTREQMQEAYRTAVMQAVGRNQAQNVRWMRG